MYQTSNPGNTPDNQWAYRQGFNFASTPATIPAGHQLSGRPDLRHGRQRHERHDLGRDRQPGALDGSNAQALAFGAPDSSVPANAGGFANFVYAGTKPATSS